MQIHELNGYTGALNDAYMAVDDGSDTGKERIKDITDPLDARIDNIIAGPASSAQEVIDARLGADGVVYPSLGDAVRGQISDIENQYNEEIGLIGNNFRTSNLLNKYWFVDKLWLKDDGTTQADASGYYVSDYIDVSNFDYRTVWFSVNNARGNIRRVAEYDSGKNFIKISKEVQTALTFDDNTVYIRVGINGNTNVKMSYSSDTTYIPYYDANTIQNMKDSEASLYTNIDDFKNNIQDLTYKTVENIRISTSDGTEIADNSRDGSDYIRVNPYQLIYYTNTAQSGYNAFYDKNKNFISSFSMSVGTNLEKYVPANAKYLRVSNAHADFDQLKMWSYANGLDVVSKEIIDPYYFNRYTGDIVNGGSLTAAGAFLKFTNISLKMRNGSIISLSWANAKTDLSGNANVSFADSYDDTEDCMRLFAGFVLIYDLDSFKFNVLYYTNTLPPKSIVLFGTDSSSRPYGDFYDQARASLVNGISNYIDSINAKEEDVLDCGNSFLFSFATDIHYYFNDTTGYFNSTNELIEKLDNDFGFDAYINGGDSMLFGSKDRTYAIGALNHVFERIDGDKVLYCMGNHDFNGVSQGGLSQDESWMFNNIMVETLLTRHNVNVNRPEGKRYFYKDFNNKKVRIIVLDTSDIDVTFDENGKAEIDPLLVYGVRQDQLTWLCDTALNVPTDEWNILVFMHVGLYTSENGFPGNNVLINRDGIINIFNKYVNKDIYSYADVDTTYNGYFTISGSGSFANYKGKLVAVLSGHSHEDGYTHKNGFNAIQTICSYPDVAQHSDRAVRTIDEVAVDFGYIDRTNEKIVLTRFGYGSDREYSY